MEKVHSDEGFVPLGSVLRPSGRLTICDWVATGNWSPKRYQASDPPDRPRVLIRTAHDADGAIVDGLRPDISYPVAVAGEFTLGEGTNVHLCNLSITIRDGVAADRLELDWDDDVSTDGLADVTFSGRRGSRRGPAEVALGGRRHLRVARPAARRSRMDRP